MDTCISLILSNNNPVCGTLAGPVAASGTGFVKCGSGNGMPGRYVSVRLTGTADTQLGLCEVAVFGRYITRPKPKTATKKFLLF